jgi:hypothetical protein
MTDRSDKIIPFPGQPATGALVLKVELVLAPYPIWRRVRIGDRASFWDLHVAIQDAMGWSHRHRHLFSADHPVSGERLRLGIPEQESFHGRQAVLPGWTLQVADVARPDHPPFLYTYHLGEEWQHEVSLEAVEAPPVSGVLPACLDGAGFCPAEGLGGPAAFRRQFESGTLPDDFDPDDFAAADVVFCDPGLLWRDRFGEE